MEPAGLRVSRVLDPRIDGGDALGLRLHHGKGDLVVQESDFPREMHSPEHGV